MTEKPLIERLEREYRKNHNINFRLGVGFTIEELEKEREPPDKKIENYEMIIKKNMMEEARYIIIELKEHRRRLFG